MERFQLRYENEVLGDPNRLALNALAPEFGREHKEFMRGICNTEVRSPAKDLLTSRGRILIRLVRPTQVYGSTDQRGTWSYDDRHPSLVPLFQEAREVGHEAAPEDGSHRDSGDSNSLWHPPLTPTRAPAEPAAIPGLR